MPDIANQQYLLNEQYRDASNLNARIRLHQLYSTHSRSLHGWIFDKLLEQRPAVARVLEVGCGPGSMWASNADRVPEGWDITLSDFSPGMLDEARRNLADAGRPFTFMQLDAQEIPFADGMFDVVIANYMLYHVPDRRKALSEMARVLARHGRMYAATPGAGHMRELDDLVEKFAPRLGPAEEFHLHSFSLESGGAQLAEYFPHVELLRFEDGPADGLVVTEAGPLVDYVLSAATYSSQVTPESAGAFTDYVEQVLARDGAIRISKVSGMFVAGERV